MAEMTSHERFSRMFAHREADRVPIIDYPWGPTVERWQREGMPEGADFIDYFGLDKVASIGGDNSPRYPGETLEETEEYIIFRNSWGVTMKNWKHTASTPQYLDYTVVDSAAWQEAKARMVASPERINWDYIKENYSRWRAEGYWIQGGLWFGYDITHHGMVGTEQLLMAMLEEPEWCVDMFNHELNVGLELLEMLWDAGYTFDSVTWPDDMGFKYKTFFSLDVYRELLKPVQKRAVDWAHARGIKACLHSCGYIAPIVPELVEIGMDSLNPIEVKAGMDPLALKAEYGDRLVLHGGINALLYNDIEALEAEMRRVIPTMKENGGYILSSDHSIPSSISFQDFTRFVEVAKELGSYA